jgi:hypothetical protein
MTQYRYLVIVGLLSAMLVGNVSCSSEHHPVLRHNKPDASGNTKVHRGGDTSVTERKFLGGKLKAADEETDADEKKRAIATGDGEAKQPINGDAKKRTIATGNGEEKKHSSNPLHATRSENGGSGALLSRRDHAPADTTTDNKTDRSGTKKEVKVEALEPKPKNDAEDRTSMIGDNIAKGRGGIGVHSGTERNIHKGNRDDDRKQLRALKAAGGGVGKLKGTPKVIKAGRANSEGDSSIACKKRAGKLCKHAAGMVWYTVLWCHE